MFDCMVVNNCHAFKVPDGMQELWQRIRMYIEWEAAQLLQFDNRAYGTPALIAV